MSTASVTNTFVNAATADADEVNTNFTDLITFLNGSVAHVDGSKAFTGNVSGITPVSAAHLTRKDYVDGVGQQASLNLATANQSIPNTSSTQIVFNNIRNAGTDAAYFTNDDTNGDITIVKAGIYAIEARTAFDTTNDLTNRQIQIKSDGTAIATETVKSVAGGYTYLGLVALAKTAAGAVITVDAYQNSGGALDVILGTAVTYLTIVRLGPG